MPAHNPVLFISVPLYFARRKRRAKARAVYRTRLSLKMTPVSSRDNRRPRKPGHGGGSDVAGGNGEGAESTSADKIARRFVEARLSAEKLDAYPGTIPADFSSAYAIQDAAIALWPDEIIGWKVGRVGPDFEARFGPHRLAGPIFRKALKRTQGAAAVFVPFIAGGFSAVEAEFVFEIAHDAPPQKKDWSLPDAAGIAGRLYVGVETAGSPLASINDLGPTVVISDFGNNAGLIVGKEIPDWQARPIGELVCESSIDGRVVGRGRAIDLPGGPLEALRFLLEHCAARGRALKAGMFVSSGAATGIHAIAPGQNALITFGRDGEIACLATAAKPASPLPEIREAR
jgi:2-keto-4-pentenoate hydratase